MSVETVFDKPKTDFGAKKITMVLPSSSSRQVKLKSAQCKWDDSDSDATDGHRNKIAGQMTILSRFCFAFSRFIYL
jgi:hypothetical protein